MSKDRKKSGMLERNRRMADLRKRQRRRSGHSTSISPAATGIAAVLVAGGLGLGAAQLAAHVDGAANRQATEAEAEAEQTAESAEETAAKMAAAAAETKKAEETTEENPADKALESAAAASEKSDKSGTKSNAGSTTGSSGSQGGSSSGSTGSTGSGSSTGTGSSTGSGSSTGAGSSTGSGSSTGAGSSTGSGSSTGAGSGTGTASGAAGSAAGSQSGAQGVTGLSSSDVAAQVEAARAAAAGQAQTAEQQAQAAAAAQAQAAAAAQAQTAQNTQAELRAQYKGGSVVSQDTVNSVGKQAFFSAQPIDDEVFARIQGKSYANGCTVSLDRLRYVRILYHGFDGQTHVGEVICNSTLAQDLLEIFGGLYDAGYPIESVRLIDEFGANDETSSVANNSSSFNFRFIDGTTDLSLHGTGLAIDINPLYNPTVFTDGSGCYPAAGAAYADRTKSFAHKIDQNDLCYQLFVQHGWTWGGSWKEDPAYMHFSKTWPPET